YSFSLRLHCLLISGTLMTATSLKLLDVQIPRTVEEGEAVRLSCDYDLEGEIPYLTTWTKNGVVFYQYTQSGGKLFPLSGADLNLQYSSATSVLFENVTKAFEGQYVCEVFTAAPHFHVVRGSGPISVAEKGDATSTGDVQLLGLDVPAYAVSGRSASLRCRFRLGDSPLYSVKWYKGTREFFRYVPSENPPKKYFILSGITVNVAESDQSSVLLEYLTLNDGGTYRCEVSADAPSFEVLTGEGILNVTGKYAKLSFIKPLK
ncbi:signal-regulatory protein beta-2-like, partial [Ixodes scapularis]|uniref:signal-regulatory protein beta-2-like n=1 Tax=Ixodes scapularis TaxID=6945 RepID=UPI001C387553